MSNADALNTNRQDYRTAIVANVTPKEAFAKICRVSEWWGTPYSVKIRTERAVEFLHGTGYFA